jgi:hypothetical protein
MSCIGVFVFVSGSFQIARTQRLILQHWRLLSLEVFGRGGLSTLKVSFGGEGTHTWYVLHNKTVPCGCSTIFIKVEGVHLTHILAELSFVKQEASSLS